MSYNTTTSNHGSSTNIVLRFDEIDWEFAQKIYGWSAFQFQGWLKGKLVNQGTARRMVSLSLENVLEAWVNNVHIFGGDFFAFGRAPVVLELHPGLNNISLRLVREVRSMGGAYPPTIQANLRINIASHPLEEVSSGRVIPDVVEGQFCTEYGSITVRNQDDGWINVQRLTAISGGEIVGVMYQKVLLAPGQSRPLKLIFNVARKLDKSMDFVLTYSKTDGEQYELAFSVCLKHTENSSLQQITFLHPSGAVSYATLRPPPVSAIAGHEKLPILLNLHGAGVEAAGQLARHMFDNAPDLPAWILTPTGMSPWSGDDWHTWGFTDALTAVAAISAWSRNTGWQGPGAFMDKVLVAGHSNGGQGTWYFASHVPDRVLGAAAASGYSSIENYVPYVMWEEADALQSAILYTARASFRHELLAENLVGLPIFQQHGSADDNVPAYHSRLMNTLLAQSGQRAEYSEIPGEGHWFDGAMTTDPMMDFYRHHLNLSHLSTLAPGTFSLVVPNSHDMGSKYGIVVDQLSTPDRLGRITVTTQTQGSHVQWLLRTENIRRFHFDIKSQPRNAPKQCFIDDLPHEFDIGKDETTFLKSDGGVWGREVALDWRTLDQRYGRQRGPLDAILRSTGPFEIVYDSDPSLAAAVQTSRNFLQYFGADSNIVPVAEHEIWPDGKGNVVIISLGTSIPEASLADFPVRVARNQVMLTTRDRRIVSIPLTAGMGGVWLRPLPNERLELVAWGYDEIGLRQAVRLIPTIAGPGVPDFVILSNAARWKGHGGAVAMGFFDHSWQISSASYTP